MNETTTATQEIKPYCSICAKDKDLKDMRTTHRTDQHEAWSDING